MPRPDEHRTQANAPYNFVPLNTDIVKGDGIQDSSIYNKELNTGIITFDIENLTPFFIRGRAENFLEINSSPIVAGSSIRGMIKSVFEILTSSKFINYEDKVISQRLLADSYLSSIYKSKISKTEKVGYFQFDKKAKEYKIKPAEFIGRSNTKSSDVHSITKVSGTENYEICSGKFPGKKRNWIIGKALDYKPSILIPSNVVKTYQDDDKRKSSINYLELVKDTVKFPNGVPVFYNDNGSKITSFGHTRNYRLPYRFPISSYVIEEENHNQNELDFTECVFGKLGSASSKLFFEDGVLSTESKLPKFSVKVLNILGGPNPSSFQLYMEQPFGYGTKKQDLYHWETEDCIKNDKGEVLQPAIRGYKRYWHKGINETNATSTGKYFVDEFTVKKIDFELYLKEVCKLKSAEIVSLLNTNSNNKIKIIIDANSTEKVVVSADFESYTEAQELFKKVVIDFFFLDSFIAKQLKITKPQYTLVKVILPKAKFTATVRFENLTDRELGALLLAIDLPQNCCHKIGMGKPLGLGTIQLSNIRLVIDDRASRYGKLLDGNNWNTPLKCDKDIVDLKTSFCKLFWEVYDPPKVENALEEFWEDIFFKEFKALLLWNENEMKTHEWLKKTSYMELGRFKEREVLPTPTQVKNNK